MKLLLVTKTLAEFSSEEGKMREISKLVGSLSVLVPARWQGSSAEVQKLKPQGYDLFLRDCRFSDWRSLRVRYHLHFYPGVSNLVKGQEWDVVHIDEEPPNLATYQVMKACRKYGRRAIFTTWQNLMKNYPPPFGFFERSVFRNAAGALAGNREAMNILHRRGFNKPVGCIPQHGVDTRVYRKEDAAGLRRNMGLRGAFVVGFVGRFAKEKGLDTLVKALALLPNETALVLVGAGPDGPKLRALAQELGVSTRVRWEPWADYREIARYMCSFDVFVLPSCTVWNVKEQFGRVLIEAMACETPVVGSDSGEIPNVIGEAGLIFHEGNAQELAGHLRRLMEDSSLREALGRRGRERVLERFSYEKVARDTVDFYKRICSVSG